MAQIHQKAIAEKSKLLGKRLSVHKRNMFRTVMSIGIAVIFIGLLITAMLVPILENPILILIQFIAFVIIVPLGFVFVSPNSGVSAKKLIVFEHGMVVLRRNNLTIITWDQIGHATINITKRDDKEIGNYQFNFYDKQEKMLINFNELDFDGVADGPLITIMKRAYVNSIFTLDITIKTVDERRY